jgi:hypothetical protein
MRKLALSALLVMAPGRLRVDRALRQLRDRAPGRPGGKDRRRHGEAAGHPVPAGKNALPSRPADAGCLWQRPGRSAAGKGYALVEFKPGTAPQAGSPEAAAPGLNLHYVLDTAASPNLYRITVMVGQQSLSRAYLAQNDRVAPAGAWVRKE